MKRKEDLAKRSGNFLALAWFRAYDKPMSEFWYYDERPMKEQVELKVIDICQTSIIEEIQIIDLQKDV